jgi:hypothetical protein
MPEELRGVRPKDLPELTQKWTTWPLAKRVEDVLTIAGHTELQMQSAVAITRNEQPGRIPVNNCCGLMCQGKTSPWGWKNDPWAGCAPCGYSMIQEGAGGLLGVFLAFNRVTDSLAFLLRVVRRRGITTAEAYADKWVAEPSLRAQSIKGFNAAMRLVQEAWPKTGQELIAWAKAQPSLKRGATGPKVVELQQMLAAAGHPVPATGNFLDKTDAAVRAFQAGRRDWDGLPLSTDGNVGPRTWWALARVAG